MKEDTTLNDIFKKKTTFSQCKSSLQGTIMAGHRGYEKKLCKIH